MKAYDAVVLGAGPAGLTAALYLCRFGLRTALVEKLAHGGQLLNTAEIANYPGFPKGAEGWVLAESFSSHLDTYEELTRFSQEILSLSVNGARFEIQLDSELIESKSVIVCSGASPKKLGLSDEQRLRGRGVSYCAMCDGMFFRDQDVAMIGGGNSALEEALYLSNIVRKLYLIHRRDQFRADKIYQDKISQRLDKIELVLGHVVTDIHGADDLTGVTVAPVSGEASRLLDVSGLFVFVGMDPVGSYLPQNVTTDEAGFVITDTEMRTSVPGLFAAGDIRSKLCRQVVTAVGDGATAAHSAFTYLEQLEA